MSAARWALGTLGALGIVAALGAGTLYARSARMLARTYDVPAHRPLVVRTDAGTVARGEHVVRALGNCTLCHGEDLGGRVYDDASPVAVIAGPNLTRGRHGAPLTDDDWVRALRYGVHRDGTSLLVMPSEVFVHASDEDVAAIIAYARQLPPVDRQPPRSRFKPLGRALYGAGRMNLMVASKTPRIDPPVATPADTTLDYGRYLADLGGCRGCHGLGLSGGRVAGPPGLPPAANLTPDSATGIGTWTEADLARALRTGRRRDGSAINEFMPWRTLARMTDEEIAAVWRYLRSVPPRPFGHK